MWVCPFNHVSLTWRQYESKEDRREGSRREEVTAGKERWMCGLRCPQSPRGQKLWKWLCRSEKVRQRRGRNKQYKRTRNSEGRKLSVTYWTNKLVCRQNGLRGWVEQKTRVTDVAMWAHPFWLNLEASHGSVLCMFPCACACACVCMRMLCKSIFVCFATSLDIPFGATDCKAVKCDLNILCLHLFPPFSLPPSSSCSLTSLWFLFPFRR